MTGPLWLARHWPLATRCRISVRRTPVRPSELDPQGRSRRPVSRRLPVDFLGSSRRCVAPLHPSPSLCPTFCGTLPACGSLRPRVGHRVARAPQVDMYRGRRPPPDLGHCAARSLPPSGPRRTTSRSPALTPRSKNPRRAGPFSAPIVPQPPPGPSFPAETGSLFGAGPTTPLGCASRWCSWARWDGVSHRF